MAYDGIAVACMVRELSEKLCGGRIDKITQPQWDEINITIRNNGKNHKLLVSASTSFARVHLTGEQKENPQKAPMFCMLLRKHLTGGKILRFYQPDFERVIAAEIECMNELGDLCTKSLFAEIMGKHSNIIITDKEDKILGSIKHVDFTVSAIRQVIPGMKYELPPSQGKLNPLKVTENELFSIIDESDKPLDKLLLDSFSGIGPLSSREIAYMATEGLVANDMLLLKEEKKHIAGKVAEFFAGIKEGRFSPVVLYKEGKMPWDFNAFDVFQYSGNHNITKGRFDSLSESLDEFYSQRDKAERIKQRTSDIMKLIGSNINRCQKKIALLEQQLMDCGKKEKYKLFGDLLTANLYKIEENSAFFEAENYYGNMEKIKIDLIPELTPPKNAQRYYNLFRKAKTTEEMSTKQIKIAKDELLYLESVQESLMRAETEDDIREIKEELVQQGYGRKGAAPKAKKEALSKPHKFVIDGFDVYVGKNNLQNDNLTLREARGSDLWFHVKNYPGSHTVLKTNGKEPSEDTLVKAAKIAAYFSKAKNSSNVPVDYTKVKNVKKPSSAKPGMVIYENYNTINVTPQEPPIR